MSEELYETALDFFDVIEAIDFSDPNISWYTIYNWLCEILPILNDISEGLLSQAQEKALTKIFRAAVVAHDYLSVKLLLKNRRISVIHMCDENGNTALHIAVEGNASMVKLVCDTVADINAKNKDGSTALHLAVVDDHRMSIVTTLLDAGADCNIQDNLGRTPLHIAVIHYNNCIYELFNYGADVNITCNDNLTPFEYKCDSHILKVHVIKMKILNFYISEKNLKHVDFNEDNGRAVEFYQNEIAGLKAQKMEDSGIGLYDLLTCDMNRFAVYAKNEKLILAENWGVYYSFICRRVNMVKKRKRLFTRGLRSLEIAVYALFGKALPEIDITFQITDYLSTEDLENLVQAALSNDDWNS